MILLTLIVIAVATLIIYIKVIVPQQKMIDKLNDELFKERMYSYGIYGKILNEISELTELYYNETSDYNLGIAYLELALRLSKMLNREQYSSAINLIETYGDIKQKEVHEAGKSSSEQ